MMIRAKDGCHLSNKKYTTNQIIIDDMKKTMIVLKGILSRK